MQVWEIDTGAVLSPIRLYQTFSSNAQLSLAIGGRSDRLDDDEGADVQCLACAPDGQRLAVGYGRNIAIYDVVSGERLLSLTCEEGEAKKVAFSPDGKLVCACNGYEWIYL